MPISMQMVELLRSQIVSSQYSSIPEHTVSISINCVEVECEISLKSIIQVKFSCSHFKAVDYFIASLDPGTSFKATKCHSYDSYLKGKCNGNPTAIFGMHGKWVSRIPNDLILCNTNFFPFQNSQWHGWNILLPNRTIQNRSHWL